LRTTHATSRQDDARHSKDTPKDVVRFCALSCLFSFFLGETAYNSDVSFSKMQSHNVQVVAKVVIAAGAFILLMAPPSLFGGVAFWIFGCDGRTNSKDLPRALYERKKSCCGCIASSSHQ